MKSLALLVAVSLASAPAYALCSVPHFGDTFHTTDAKGAVLIVSKMISPQDATLADLKFNIDGQEASFDKVVLAPGLVAYRLPAGAKEGAIDAGASGVAKVVAIDAKTPLLPAPKLSTLKVEMTMGIRGSTVFATATLGSEAPTDAVALVVTDAKGKALTWGTVVAGSKTQTVMSRGRCGMLPNGTVQPMGRQLVKVFWVDVNGRRSPASRAVKVVAKTVSGY